MTNRRTFLLTKVNETRFQSLGQRVAISIAGVRVVFITPNERLAARLRTYFKAYIEAVGEPLSDAEVWMDFLVAPLSCPDLWEDEDPEFEIHGDQAVQRDFVARKIASDGFANAPIRAVAWLSPDGDDSFQNFLRWLMPDILVRKNAFLLHGAAVVRDDKGFVFFGQSGAGKSTSVSLITAVDHEAVLLGDDAVIIQIIGERAYVHSAPLGCGYSREAPPRVQAQLAGLFALRQDLTDRIEALSNGQGVATLLASAMNCEHGRAIEERLSLALRFMQSNNPVEALHFVLDPGFWTELIFKRSAHVEQTR